MFCNFRHFQVDYYRGIPWIFVCVDEYAESQRLFEQMFSSDTESITGNDTH